MSIIFSLLSLLFSIYVFLSNKKSQKNKRTYDALTPIYLHSLTKDIPLSFSNLRFDLSQENNGVDQFQKDIRTLIKEIKVIRIIDEETYKIWYKQLADIEDFVINSAELPNTDNERHAELLSELTRKLNDLYKTILSENFNHVL